MAGLSVVKRAFSNTCHQVGCGAKKATKHAKKTAHVLSDIVANTSALKKVMKIGARTIEGASFLKHHAVLPALGNTFRTGIDVIELFEIFPDAYDVITTPFQKKNIALLAGMIAGVIADIGGVILFLDDVKAIKLAKISASLGRTPVLGLVTKVALGTAVKAVGGFANGCFAAHAIQDLVKASNSAKKIKSSLEVAQYTSEVAGAIFGLFGAKLLMAAGVAATIVTTTTIVVPISLGLVAAGIGLTVFIYKQTHKTQLSDC